MASQATESRPWPPHGSATRPWTTNPLTRDSAGRRPPREDRLLTTVEVSIPPEIAGLTPPLSNETAAATEAATAAIVRLDELGRAPLGALGGFLLRSEAVATSKIERISSDLTDFARALAGHRAGDAARQTAAAVVAIGSLVERATDHPLTVAAINRSHGQLLAEDAFEGGAAGTLRTQQNWLGGSNFSPRDAVYVPPPPGLIDALLADLTAFARRTDLSAVAQAAIVHAQFESIHPYTDGNGRIGRALINAVIRRRQLTRRILVPIASVMLADTDRYFAQLDAYRRGDADGFVRSIADASLVVSGEATLSAEALQQLPAEWREQVRPRKGSATDALLEHLLETPVLTDKAAASAAGSSVRRAYDALDRLTGAGVLTEVTGDARNRVWVVGDVLDELDRLEARIGRRVKPLPR